MNLTENNSHQFFKIHVINYRSMVFVAIYATTFYVSEKDVAIFFTFFYKYVNLIKCQVAIVNF